MSQIETIRLILRPFVKTDMEALCFDGKQPSWLQSVAVEMYDIEKPCASYTIQLKSSNTVIGHIFAGKKPELNNELEMGYYIAEKYQNNGYATEAGKAMIWWAFEKAGQDALSAVILPANKASRRVIEKLGFIYGGTKRLTYHVVEHEFDYFRLYHIARFPGPEWSDIRSLYKMYPLEPMGAFFNSRADGYNAVVGTGMYDYEKFGSCFPETDEKIQILNVGCGTGIELEHIWKQAPNAHITCLDLSRGMLDLLEKNHPGDQGRITVVEASYLDWAYPKEAFDIVTSHATMHHFFPEEKTGVYRKILGTLKPNGSYIEGDFILGDDLLAKQYRQRHEAITEGLTEKEKASGDYHVDIPLTLNVQMKLLQEAGFGSVKILADETKFDGSRVILEAKK
ncbi:MAG: bifunctional GNAT family N-acetyltransferase/class I SAM-dependent methyltransferase [Oscillospiraceae bacterium]|nr:bifunctional GNAT family N-acetyltransferase/class I SAM-dependent methyltransferase [Oscillospiraceae bacterium]